MTDRLQEMFAAKKAAGQKALIPFITSGDPDLDTTKRLVLAMEGAGADLVELGIPFSDPVAEGPVIQDADRRALENGLKTDDIFDTVSSIRDATRMPLVFMTYINSIFTYGKERFFTRCSNAGLDGVIVPDLPFEEKDEVSHEAGERGIPVISLVAPTSRGRIKMIASGAEGFLYCVTSKGVTGTRDRFDTDFEAYCEEVGRYARVPTALGFGISTPQQAADLQKYADGVIVGSAVVRRIAGASNPDAAVRSVSDFIVSLRRAMDNAPSLHEAG